MLLYKLFIKNNYVFILNIKIFIIFEKERYEQYLYNIWNRFLLFLIKGMFLCSGICLY